MSEHKGRVGHVLRARVTRALSICTADETVAGRLRARQIEAVLKLAPLTMTANFFNALAVLFLFWTVGTRLFLSAWACATLLVVFRGLRAALRRRGRRGPSSVSSRATRRALLHAVVLSLLWAALPLVLLNGADFAHQLFLIALITGVMCAGAFALATIPLAASVYVAILGVCTSVALVRSHVALAWPTAVLMGIHVCVVIASVWATARTFGARLVAEMQAEHQSQVVGLLLRDYEETGSSVLWDADENGRLARGADKMAAVLGRDGLSEHIILGELVRAGGLANSSEQRHAIDSLCAHLERGSAFRDIVITTRSGETERWWSCTANPVVNDDGKLAGWRGVLSDVSVTELAKQRMTWLAHHDPLTGLANRYRFRNYLAELLASQITELTPSAIICIDLDNFKDVNDTLGHAVGDELLQETSRRLMDLVREGDLVARLGGDEFAVVLRQVASPAEALAVGQRLLRALETPCSLKGATVVARASMGVALAPQHGTEIDSLLNHADLALYAAKAGGKGNVREFTSQMADVTRRRLRVEHGLRTALERNEMWLEFQPQVNLETWQVTGFEALLRWWNPELGLVSPAEFIPIAEESGVIRAMGQWVLDTACLQAATWKQPLLVSVNVSPIQAMSQDMFAITTSALSKTGLSPERLELEITESVFMTESQAAIAALGKLRDAGVRIALDDFGTGYSSLSYLQRFPFDTLKIDRSFVKEIAAQKSQRAIVKMIMTLARTLGMRTVAEGVEDGAQLGVLNRYRCETIQGYLVSKPIKAEQIAGFLSTFSLMPKGSKTVDPVATDFVPMPA